ncbi:MAG: DNA polymerase III subunit delta [Candidatus Kryptoniota bacterium]
MNQLKSLAANIKKKKVKQCYLLTGTEEYLLDRAAILLLQGVIPPEERQFNQDVFDGSECTSEEIISSMLSYPFIGEHRLTFVRRFDDLNKKEKASIADKINQIPESNIVCFSAGDIKISEEPYSRIAKNAEVLRFNKLKSADLQQWISEEAESFGKEIAPAAITALIEFVGDSLGELHTAIEKLSLFVGESKDIEIDDVSMTVGASRTYNIFELQKAIANKNLPAAFKIALKMVGSGTNPVQIVFHLTKFFLILVQIKHLLAKGKSREEINKSVFEGRWSYIDEYIFAANKYTFEELKRAVVSLIQVDRKIKSTGLSDTAAITIILTEAVPSLSNSTFSSNSSNSDQ